MKRTYLFREEKIKK